MEHQRVTEFMQSERERLMRARREHEDAIAKIDAELKGIEAYFAAMGDPTKLSGRRSGIRARVRMLIAESPSGLTRAALLERMEARGDKSATNSVSNALTNLKKRGELTLREGVYQIAEQAAESSPKTA